MQNTQVLLTLCGIRKNFVTNSHFNDVKTFALYPGSHFHLNNLFTLMLVDL